MALLIILAILLSGCSNQLTGKLVSKIRTHPGNILICESISKTVQTCKPINTHIELIGRFYYFIIEDNLGHWIIINISYETFRNYELGDNYP